MKPVVGATLAAAVLLTSFVAQAECLRSGYIVRVTNFEVNSLIYLRPSSLTNYYYQCITRNDALRVAASAAAATKARAQLTGDVDTCPASGNSRDIGKCTAVRVTP